MHALGRGWEEEKMGMRKVWAKCQELSWVIFFIWYESMIQLHFLWHVEIQLSQHLLLKRLLIPHWMLLAPLSKSIDSRCVGLFLYSQFYSIDLYVCPYDSNTLFWSVYFCSKFQNCKLLFLQLCFLLSRLFSLCWVPWIATWISAMGI